MHILSAFQPNVIINHAPAKADDEDSFYIKNHTKRDLFNKKQVSLFKNMPEI